MCLTDFIKVSPSPRPRITSWQAKEVLEVYYDIHGDLQSLGGAHYLNYRLETDTGYYVLTVCHGDYPADELHAQLDALKCLENNSRASQDTLRVVPAESGGDLLSLDLAGHVMHFCLLKFVKDSSYTVAYGL